MLNVDEILRIPQTKLIVNLKGNKPIILDKVIYTEHSQAKKLSDSSILDYNPEWTKNNTKLVRTKTQDKPRPSKQAKNKPKRKKLTWDNF